MARSPRQMRTNRYIQEKKSKKCIFSALFILMVVCTTVFFIAYFSHYHKSDSTEFNASMANQLIEETIQVDNNSQNKSLEICNGNKSYTLRGNGLNRVGECDTEEIGHNKTLVKCKLRLTNIILTNSAGKICNENEIAQDPDLDNEEFQLEFETRDGKVDKISVHSISSYNEDLEIIKNRNSNNIKSQDQDSLQKSKKKLKRETEHVGLKEIFGLYVMQKIVDKGIYDNEDNSDSDLGFSDYDDSLSVKCHLKKGWPCQKQ